MTNEQIIAAMKAKVSGLNIKALKEMAMELADKFDEASAAVSDVVLDVLMEKMPEAEFVAFCEEVENAM